MASIDVHFQEGNGPGSFGGSEEAVTAVLAQCRLVVGNGDRFELWSGEFGDALPEVCRWALSHDPALFESLRRQPATRAVLMDVAARRLRAERGSVRGDLEAAISVMALVPLCDQQGLVPDFSVQVKQLLAKDVADAGVQARVWDRLVELLRPMVGQGRAMVGSRRGWPYLLTQAGTAMFRARRLADSYRLLEEAWPHVGELAPGRVGTAKAVGHMATMYMSTVCHLPAPWDEEWDGRVAEAARRLEQARELLVQHSPSEDVASALLNLGLSKAQSWYMLRRRGRVGWIDGETQRLAALQEAEQDMWGSLPPEAILADRDDGHARSRLPARLRDAEVRLHLDSAAALYATGDHAQAMRSARKALELSSQLHHVLDAALTLARSEPKLPDKIAHWESLFRYAHEGELEGLNDWQREKTMRRLAQAADELGDVLYREKRSTAAWFWKRQAHLWQPSADGPDHLADEREDEDLAEAEFSAVGSAQTPVVGAKPVAEAPRQRGGGADPTVLLQDALRRQNIPGIVLVLMTWAASTDPLHEQLRVLHLVEQWRPPRRRPRPGRPPLDTCTTAEQAVRAALELADEFACIYTPWLRADLLNRLVRYPGQDLSVADRREIAGEAYEAAVTSGRWGQALRALQPLLGIAEHAGDVKAINTAVRQIHDIARRSLSEATGTADLIDLAHQVSKASLRLAGWLASHGHPQLAFETAHLSIGVVHRMCLDDAGLAEEFLLAEHFSRRTEEAGNRLFELMRTRLDTPRKKVVVPSARSAPGAAGSSTVLVQLIETHNQGLWVLGRSPGKTACSYWAVKLKTTTASLMALREALWHDLRDSRRGRRGTGALARLHHEIVEPIAMHLTPATDLAVIPHRRFAGIPLHAAQGPDGYLIERLRVSYLPSAAPQTPKMRADNALVGGWDPRIGAVDEGREVQAQLRALGFHVRRPRTAAQGRNDFLTPQGQWDITHVAAHGEFQPWPASTDSRLRLSENVSLTAGEWLSTGCRSTFVFVNACNVGRHAPHAGDLNGFPLALRARGTVTEVSALGPVPSDAARSFARRFYSLWPGRDSLTAYQETCQDAINRGAPPCDWAPYMHTGNGLHLPAPPAGPVRKAGRSSTARAAEKRRRRRAR
ncbi:CHAT domain-containing protein [Streptomyces sp. 142MFCol3.1]|uniref:CHAT domain-containing protein n=1 Tax=Streptomyces sp. 142MFCol3.1 TaxID=1172179 RepID=UPI0004902D01|nr:CHAT domain-containing protein [Streptomyces sp. 142MFCol3.1]